MGERPLPEEVARAARAYLTALVSPSARADAWHDLLAEVRYWQDDELLPVLRLAHQVVSQHERVTDEAAAHALVDVARVEVDDLAVVLNASLDTAQALRERVDRAQESGDRARVLSVGGVASGGHTDMPGARASDPGGHPSTTADVQDVAADPQDLVEPAPVTAAAPSLRIGFDDQDVVDADSLDDDSNDWDDSDDWDDELSSGLLSYRRLVVIAIVVWVLVVVAWLLGGS